MSARGALLLVEDDPQVRDVLATIFTDAGYSCHLAEDGERGYAAAVAAPPAVTVTDVRMPRLDGIGLLRRLRELDPEAAVVILTGAADVGLAIECLKLGAADLITKPVNVEQLLIAVERALERRQLLLERREHEQRLESQVAATTRELRAAYDELHETYRATLTALGSALDTRDVGTEAHSLRVHGYALVTARVHGLPESEFADLATGVLLHDIGKIGIPDAILLKPGRLTAEEWQVMRRHPEIGRRLIENIPFLRGALKVVYHHHERWDGSGYPQGLRGEAIPIGARIFAVVDAFDAMTFDRPYSKAIPVAAARAEIGRSAGTHFDPAVVASFARVPSDTLEEIRQRSLVP